MADFDVNIRTTADTSGAEKEEAALEKVAEARDRANSGGGGGGRTGPSQADLAYQQQSEASARRMLETEEAINQKEAARIALQERQQSILIQRQALVSSEVEALGLEAAGESEHAAALQAEIAERRLALQLQQSTNLTEEQSLVLARQKIQAETAITAAKVEQAAASTEQAGVNLLAGASLAKARNEAITFGRELSSGASTGRTLSALLGSLGPHIAVASIAVFALVKNFGKVQEFIQGISDAIQGVSGTDLAAAITKADEFGIAIRKAGQESSSSLSSNIERMGDELTQLTNKYREAVLANDDETAASLQEQIAQKRSLLEFDRFALDIAQATETLEARKAQAIQEAADARRREVEIQREGFQLDQQFREARDAGRSEAERLSEQRTRIGEIRTALEGLGIAADSPNDAYQKSIGLADTQRNAVVKLAIEWQKLSTQVSKGAADQQKESEALVSKLQEVQEAAAKPNISLEDRLKLLKQELELLDQIKQSEIDRAQAASQAHPEEAARITEINRQLANRSSQPDFGTPAAADRSANLLSERAALSKATGIPEDVQALTQALDDQSNAIEQVIDAAKTGAGNVTGTVGELDAAVSEGFKSFNDSLQPIPEKVTGAAGQVNEKISSLGAAAQAGFESIGSQIAQVQASLQRTIEAQAARIGALERR